VARRTLQPRSDQPDLAAANDPNASQPASTPEPNPFNGGGVKIRLLTGDKLLAVQQLPDLRQIANDRRLTAVHFRDILSGWTGSVTDKQQFSPKVTIATT
jgi:hypothetical protein